MKLRSFAFVLSPMLAFASQSEPGNGITDYRVNPWPDSERAEVIGDWPADWQFAGSLELEIPSRRKGGWSSLASLETPLQFQAWSDRDGNWVSFGLELEQGRLTGLSVLQWGHVPLSDVESTARVGTGWLLGRDGTGELVIQDGKTGQLTSQITLPDYHPVRNSGIEALTRLGPDLVLAVAEKDQPHPGTEKQRLAWLVDTSREQVSIYPFSLQLKHPYPVTALTTGKNNTVFLLQRQYRNGTSDIVVNTLKLSITHHGNDKNIIQSIEPIVHLRASRDNRKSLDNYEALTSFEDGQYRYLLMLSDDNFDSQPAGRQHSLLYLLRQAK